MCIVHSWGIDISVEELYSSSVDWPTRRSVCGWPHSCSLFSLVLHDIMGAEGVFVINGGNPCRT